MDNGSDRAVALPRVFWLGMHKILVQTELKRLRMLGYEVFNPPYLSRVRDQSAHTDWDADQHTTLPPEIFLKLSRYNFFYNKISHEIAEILNEWFDAIIVTILPLWLYEILKVYRGKVIFRVYGQSYLLSEEMASRKLIDLIVSRDNYWFVPHAAEAVQDEELWIREREEVVPYCLPPDIMDHKDVWGLQHRRRREIAVSCPNIKNPYYENHYHFLKKYFKNKIFRFYGVQLSEVNDPQVVGTLERSELISRFISASGYCYTYTESRVCYLPPIEMMILGGPVLFLKGSLLDRYFHEDAPGRCASPREAVQNAKRLTGGDGVFISEVIASQSEVRKRYMPDAVWPVFDSTFRKILAGKNRAPGWIFKDSSYKEKIKGKNIYIFFHFPGCPVIFNEGEYSAYDGIPRVVRRIVSVLTENPDVNILITAYAYQVTSVYGYFRGMLNTSRLYILCINPGGITMRPDERKILQRGLRAARTVVRRSLPGHIRLYTRKIIAKAVSYVKYFNGLLMIYVAPTPFMPQHIRLINSDENCINVLIPHYYHFPDAVQLDKKIILYLPDYMPHFFHETGEFTFDEGLHTQLGKRLAAKADKIFCNSEFTKSYLPASRLAVKQDKINVAWLPCLNDRNDVRNKIPASGIDRRIGLKPYIFYPVRPHPNKNISFLLHIFDRLVSEGRDINLVLTTTLECDPKAYKMLHSIKSSRRVISTGVVSDNMLSELYQRAAALCFTSLAEGNFPPQIHEALKYDTPVIAGRMKFITERIPEGHENSILLCEPGNLREFVSACHRAFDNRENILQKQRQLLAEMESDGTPDRFRGKILEIFDIA